MKKLFLAIFMGGFVIGSLLFQAEARASDPSVKRYTFSGTVEWAYGTPLGLQASTGDIVTGTFGYDTSIPLSVEHGTYGPSSSWGDSFQNDPALFSVTINGVTVFGDPSGFHFQLFDEYYGMWDEIKCYSQWEQWPSEEEMDLGASGPVMNSVFFQVLYPHELFSSDISYPSIINFSGQETHGWVQSSSFFPGGQNGQVRFTITNISSMDTPAQPPVADAGPDQTIESGVIVQLDASNSSPSAGVTYQWTQLSGTPVTLSDPTIVNPTFIAPNVGQQGASLVFQVSVTTTNGQSSQASCTVTVTYVNQPPGNQCVQCASGLVSWWAAEGNANDNKGTNIGTLNGGATYASGKVGQAFSVNGNTGSIVVVPDNASLNFGTHSPMTIELWAYRTGTNWAQHILGKRSDCGVNIIPDHNYQMGWYNTDGDWFGSYSGGALTGGKDADLPLSTWTHLAGTFDGTTFKFYVNGALAGTGTGTLGPIFATPFTMGTSGTCGNYGQSFVGLLDEVSLYNRALSVTEINAIYNAGSAGKCRQVPNQPPAASAGAGQEVEAGDQVTLDGSGSSDPENGALSYLWEQVSGLPVQLSDSAVAKPAFTAPNVSPAGVSLSFKLTVTDPGGLISSDTCIVNVLWINQPPVADAGSNQTVNAGSLVTLNGSNSTDPDDGIASYRWKQLSGIPSVTLSDTTAIQPTFSVPNVPRSGATLTFELTVTDRGGLQSIVQCAVNVQWVNTPPTADAGENVQILSKDQIATVLNGKVGDADADSLVYTWMEGKTTLFSGQAAADWTAPLNLGAIPPLSIGAHTLALVVSDGNDSVHDDMTLTIENSAPTAAPSGAGTYQINMPVTLSGEVADYDGDHVSYTWLEGDTKLGEGTVQTSVGGDPVMLPPYVISNLSLGVHTLTLRVSDGINTPLPSSITVTIDDTTAPTLAPVADKTILWPPNHQMVPVTIAVHAADNSGLPVNLKVAIACNEAPGGTAYWTEPVINQAAGSISMQFMAERSGKGDGRQYTVTITATDESGNESTANVKIVVPHDQGKK